MVIFFNSWFTLQNEIVYVSLPKRDTRIRFIIGRFVCSLTFEESNLFHWLHAFHCWCVVFTEGWSITDIVHNFIVKCDPVSLMYLFCKTQYWSMKVLVKEGLCREINASLEDVSSHDLNKSEFTSTLIKDKTDNDKNLFTARFPSLVSIFQSFPIWFCGFFYIVNFSFNLKDQQANH